MSVSGESSVDEENPDEASSSDENGPVITMARTAARQLESHLAEPGDGEQLGRTRAQTRVLNQDAARLARGRGGARGGCPVPRDRGEPDVDREPDEARYRKCSVISHSKNCCRESIRADSSGP